MREVFITDAELVSGFGFGKEAAQKAVFNGETAFSQVSRFPVSQFACREAATVPGLIPKDGESFAVPMLEFLAEKVYDLPEETPLLLASTVGEIDTLSENGADTLHSILETTLRLFRKRSGRIVSAACASTNAALDRAYRMISTGIAETVIVAACDIVSEFAFSGFASIGAMSPERPRPYDKNRSGLFLGEAAGVLVLSANRGESTVCISGTAMGGDALHITAPQTDGANLARVINSAINGKENIAAVLGHGTGTVYNDIMEINAIRSAVSSCVPLASAKGACGHTLGASGMIQTILALEVFRRRELFPQAGLQIPETGAEKMVSSSIQKICGNRILSLNSGFGGLNAAVLLEELA